MLGYAIEHIEELGPVPIYMFDIESQSAYKWYAISFVVGSTIIIATLLYCMKYKERKCIVISKSP